MYGRIPLRNLFFAVSHIISCWKRGRADMRQTTSNSVPLFAVVLLWSVASYVSAAKAGLRFDDASGACPAGFERGCVDGNRCYRLVKSLADWDAARSGCFALNSNLVVIRDREEQNCISDICFTLSGSSWKEIHLDWSTQRQCRVFVELGEQRSQYWFCELVSGYVCNSPCIHLSWTFTCGHLGEDIPKISIWDR